jgi:tetratricopeptide (TPR) repeat protein
VKIAIAHAAFDPRRAEPLTKLVAQLRAMGVEPFIFASKTREHSTVWALRIWKWIANQLEHVALLNDDVEVHPEFLRVLEAAIVGAPDEILSLHGQGLDIAKIQGRWVRFHDYTGPAVVLPPRAARMLADFWEANPSLQNVEGVNEDNVAAQCMYAEQRPAWATIPALVRHRTEVPSTLGYDNHPMRGSSVDWARFPNVDLTKPETWAVQEPPPWIENPWLSVAELERMRKDRLYPPPPPAPDCAFCGTPHEPGLPVTVNRQTGAGLCVACMDKLTGKVQPRRLPISACLVVAHDPRLPRTLETLRKWVDDLVVLATPDALEIARKFADTVLEDEPEDAEDFARKRTRAFAAAKHKTVIWADADDEIHALDRLPGELELLANLSKGGKPAIFYYPYEYAFDAQGRCLETETVARLFFDRTSVVWKGRTHELAVPVNERAVIRKSRESMVWRHHQSPNDVRKPRDERLLEKMYEEDPTNSRTLFLLTRVYAARGEFDRARGMFAKCEAASPWETECRDGSLMLAELALLQGNYEDALDLALRAIAEDVGFKTSGVLGMYAAAKAYFFLAKESNNPRLWRRCIAFYRQAMAGPHVEFEKMYAYRLLHYAYIGVGDVQSAFEACVAGLKLEPKNAELKAAKAYYAGLLSAK